MEPFLLLPIAGAGLIAGAVFLLVRCLADFGGPSEGLRNYFIFYHTLFTISTVFGGINIFRRFAHVWRAFLVNMTRAI